MCGSPCCLPSDVSRRPNRRLLNSAAMGHTDRQSDLLMVEGAAEDNICGSHQSLPAFRFLSTEKSNSERRSIDRWECTHATITPEEDFEGRSTLLSCEIILVVVVLTAKAINFLYGPSLSAAHASCAQVPFPISLLPVAHNESRISSETLAVSLSSGIIALYIVSCRCICCRFLKLAQELDESPP